jgi:hypothetical protein
VCNVSHCLARPMPIGPDPVALIAPTRIGAPIASSKSRP